MLVTTRLSSKGQVVIPARTRRALGWPPSTNPGGVPVPENVGVVDAGVILTRLDRRRRSHAEATALFASSARGAARLDVSIVNLAEALQHARAYSEATGVDLIAVLAGFDVRLVQRTRGVAAAVVNGEVLLRDGKHTGALPGQLLRGPRARRA